MTDNDNRRYGLADWEGLSLPIALRIIEALIDGDTSCLTESDARSIAEPILNERRNP